MPNSILNITVHTKLLEIIADNDQTQYQMGLTKLSNQSQMVEQFHTLPVISDLDIPIVGCDINPSYNNQGKYTLTGENTN